MPNLICQFLNSLVVLNILIHEVRPGSIFSMELHTEGTEYYFLFCENIVFVLFSHLCVFISDRNSVYSDVNKQIVSVNTLSLSLLRIHFHLRHSSLRKKSKSKTVKIHLLGPSLRCGNVNMLDPSPLFLFCDLSTKGLFIKDNDNFTFQWIIDNIFGFHQTPRRSLIKTLFSHFF